MDALRSLNWLNYWDCPLPDCSGSLRDIPRNFGANCARVKSPCQDAKFGVLLFTLPLTTALFFRLHVALVLRRRMKGPLLA